MYQRQAPSFLEEPGFWPDTSPFDITIEEISKYSNHRVRYLSPVIHGGSLSIWLNTATGDELLKASSINVADVDHRDTGNWWRSPNRSDDYSPLKEISLKTLSSVS